MRGTLIPTVICVHLDGQKKYTSVILQVMRVIMDLLLRNGWILIGANLWAFAAITVGDSFLDGPGGQRDGYALQDLPVFQYTLAPVCTADAGGVMGVEDGLYIQLCLKQEN